jgi:glucose-1-phosphatase
MKRTDLKAIIFDFGGVILDIDYQRTVDAFRALGYADFDQQYGKMKQSGIFDLLETGKISNEQFITELKQSIPHISDEEIVAAWNAIILDFPEGRLEFISNLRDQIPTFLLSNTNAIHIENFHEVLKNRTGKSHMSGYFQKVYYSNEIGLRKPDAAAFQLILDEQQLNPERTLFIDDSPQHIEAAQKLGIETLHLKSIHDLESELAPFLT